MERQSGGLRRKGAGDPPDVDLLKISEEEADMLGGEAELPPLWSGTD